MLWPVEWAAKDVDGARKMLTGGPADVAADLAALAAAGVRHLSLTFQTATLGETLERMQRFTEEVLPLVHN